MLKKIFLTLLLIFCFTLLTLWSLESSVYNNFLSQQLQRVALERNLGLQIRELAWQGWQIKASGVELKIPSKVSIPIYASLDELELHLEPRYLLMGTISATIKIKAYKGELLAPVNFNLLLNKINFEVSAKNFDLSGHKQLQTLNITAGTLNLALQNGTVTANVLTSADLTIGLNNFNKPEPTIIPSYLTRAPLDIKIPAITKLTCLVKTALRADVLELSNFESVSNLGKLSAQGSFQFTEHNRIQKLDLNISGDLTSTGQAELGAYVMLLSQGKLSSTQATFQAKLEFPPLIMIPQ